jgi:hypothetical protein
VQSIKIRKKKESSKLLEPDWVENFIRSPKHSTRNDGVILNRIYKDEEFPTQEEF